MKLLVTEQAIIFEKRSESNKNVGRDELRENRADIMKGMMESIQSSSTSNFILIRQMREGKKSIEEFETDVGRLVCVSIFETGELGLKKDKPNSQLNTTLGPKILEAK